jgi:hypothetical protein
MVKKIYLEHSFRNQMDHVLGKFLDHDCYDIVLSEDADVYEPLTPLQIANGETHSEKNILCKFRKKVFSKSMTDAAYKALRSGAIMSDNRGLAAGIERDTEFQKLPDGLGSRRWVTQRQKAVIQYMIKGSPKSVTGEDMLQEIYDTTPNLPLQGRGSGAHKAKGDVGAGAIWIVKKVHDFDFDEWYNSVKDKSIEERRMAADHILNDLISDTTYANGVRSGVGGFMDRYPRIPFCRETGWSASHHKLYEDALPLFQEAAKVFQDNLPIRFAGQMEAMNRLGKDWQIGDTPYTTLTINRDFRTAAHRDVGDLCESWETHENPRGFSNLLVLDNGKQYQGFYLCFPEFRVAADIRAGDMIMMNAHRIHSNAPAFAYEEDFERMSVVMYFRESMLECGSKKYEDARRSFVYMRKNNKEHPLWHEGWNGVSPSMWDTEEWGQYLGNNGLLDEAEEVLNKLGIGSQNGSLEQYFV